MPAPPVTYTITFTLNQDRTSGSIRYTDTTNWAGSGIDPADVEIAWGFKGPDDVQYRQALIGAPNNIFPDVQLWAEAPLPTAAGVVQTGDYIVSAIARVSAPSPFTGDYDADDSTNNLCSDFPAFELTPDINCNAAWVTVNDTTAWEDNGWTVNSRLLTLNYPLPSQHAAITSTSTTVTTEGENIYRGTWSVQGTWSVTKDNLTVSVSGSLQFAVECSAESCKRWCQIRSIFSKMLTARAAGGTAEANRLEELAKKLVWLSTMIDYSQSCGSSSQTSQLSAEFTILAGDCDCGCDEESDLITPIFGSSGGAMWLPVQGNQIQITAGAGTYTFAVAPALISLINSLYNTVVTSTDGSVTVTPATVGITTTYNLSVVKPARDSVRWTLTWNLRSNTIASSTVEVVGTTFDGVGITFTQVGNVYEVQGFVAAGTPNYMPHVRLKNRVITPSHAALLANTNVLRPEVVTQNVGIFSIALALETDLVGGSQGNFYNHSWYDTFISDLVLELEVYKLN